MKAIILAAGYATRLYPLTLNTPKALLPIAGKPIIEHILDKIQEIDAIDQTYIISNHKFYSQFEAWAGESNKKDIKIIDDGTTTEEGKLGAIGDIEFVIEKEGIIDDILIIAGDNFLTYSLKDFYDYQRKVNENSICVQELDALEDLRRMANVLLDEKNKVIKLKEKPENPFSKIAAFATYILKSDTIPLFDIYLKEPNSKDAPGYFLEWLYSRKDIYAYKFHGECYDIGTHDSYKEVTNKFR